MQAHTQSIFAAALLQPKQDITALFAIEATQAQERFAVYRNNVVLGLSAAMAQGFPAIVRLLGERYFAALAAEFVRAHPPRSAILLHYGEAFADFLAGFQPLFEYPYLPDVARLEWLRRCSYHAADTDTLSATRLASMAAPDVASIVINLAPSVQLLQATYPALSLWQAQQIDGTAVTQWQPEDVLIFRLEQRVYMRLASAEDRALLELCIRPISLEALCAELASQGHDPARCLAAALRDGLLYPTDPGNANNEKTI